MDNCMCITYACSRFTPFMDMSTLLKTQESVSHKRNQWTNEAAYLSADRMTNKAHNREDSVVRKAYTVFSDQQWTCHCSTCMLNTIHAHIHHFFFHSLRHAIKFQNSAQNYLNHQWYKWWDFITCTCGNEVTCAWESNDMFPALGCNSLHSHVTLTKPAPDICIQRGHVKMGH